MFVCISIRAETPIELYTHAGKISVPGVMSCLGVCEVDGLLRWSCFHLPACLFKNSPG